ncbi:neuropeptides B/W receptor type 2 [Erinaceus europaeus]|uniref:Neuropeptides B/W receptor type 2 n=1 Tax=Erinaceus europaeus TaxID=9365 RepID=A0A1S2ZU33_ERIEU|nr:neuropeptides B/W receptor type 2 [Erinaceus europaeus]
MQAAVLEPPNSTGYPWPSSPGTCVSQALTTHSKNDSIVEGLPGLYVALPVVYSVICALGLTGNTAVIYVLLREPKMQTVTHVFILNLAVADVLFTLVLPVSIAEHLLQRWPFGELLCKLVLAADHYNLFSSAYFLAAMSVDRYRVVLATARSLRAPRGRTLRAARRASRCIWLGVTVLVLPFFAFAGVYRNELQVRSCGLSFPQPERAWFQASRIYTLVLGFVLPMCALCGLYADLLRRLHTLRLRSGAKALGKARRKVTALVLAVLAVGLVCWTPFHLASVVALTTDVPQTPLVIGISYTITSLSYASSCLNPFLYAFLDSGFRKNFWAAFRCQGP